MTDEWLLRQLYAWGEAFGADHFSGVGVWQMLEAVGLMQDALAPPTVAAVRRQLEVRRASIEDMLHTSIE